MKEPGGDTLSQDMINRSSRKRPFGLSAVDMELENNEMLSRDIDINQRRKCYDDCLDGKAVLGTLDGNRTVPIRSLGVLS